MVKLELLLKEIWHLISQSVNTLSLYFCVVCLRVASTLRLYHGEIYLCCMLIHYIHLRALAWCLFLLIILLILACSFFLLHTYLLLILFLLSLSVDMDGLYTLHDYLSSMWCMFACLCRTHIYPLIFDSLVSANSFFLCSHIWCMWEFVCVCFSNQASD